MRGVFVDANESLAVIFERLEKPGDPKVLIHRNPDITPDQYPKILDGAEIAIVDREAEHVGLAQGDRVVLAVGEIERLDTLDLGPQGSGGDDEA